MKKLYEKVVGYSSLENVDLDKMHHMVNVNKAIIDSHYTSKPTDKILVAGVGQGEEAIFLSKAFQLRTIGVDINIIRKGSLLAADDENVLFQKQDLMNLAFNEKSFSIIYCMHVLEHVQDHNRVLKEFSRVLKPGGILFIGFPNKHRLIGYMGTSQKASLWEKMKWNLNDYKDRLRGRFENRYGAHAGFSEQEFIRDASDIFIKRFNRSCRDTRQIWGCEKG